jgi:dCMP deaminase
MILGITGLYASGKDTVAEFLKEKGFFHISLSDMIREEAKKRKIPITRENLFTLGNELRAEFGSSVLAEKALEKVQDGENYAITSIRNIDEAKTILARENAILINIVAPQAERLRRLVERNREQDPTTLKALKDAEEKEMSDDPAAMQIHKVAKMAKITVNNDGTTEQLKEKIDRLVEDHLYKLQPSRPSWDEYFMQIAETIKLRSTCLSAGKGTILVRDKRIISTGYNGSPKGVKHCNEGGCKRCKNRHLGKIKSGVYSEPCICCHSEENAIVQAAVHGISTDGAVLYTTFTPCVTCAKMIINAQIKEVIAKVLYPDDDAMSLLKEAGIKVRLFKGNHKFS